MREQALDWQRRAQDSEKRLAEERSTRKAEEDRRRKAEEHVRELRKHIDSREGELKASNAAKVELEKALAHAQAERRNLNGLLETKTTELKEAQTYMSKVDDVSDSEVFQLAKNINAAIFQIAAKVADDCHSAIGAQASRTLRDQAAARLEKGVGSDLPRILASADHTHDNILIQTALQALLASFLSDLASAWPTPVDGRISLLQSIYAEMCQREPQSVFGKWRTITLTYMRAVLPKQSTTEVSAARWLSKQVTDVLLASGYGQSAQEAYEFVKQNYMKGLKSLAAQAIEFGHTTGGRIVSADIGVVAVPANEVFQSELMEDEWADPKHPESVPQGARVFCTTRLGLVRTERKREGGGADAANTPQELFLLKPSVVMEDTVKDILADMGHGQ
ncbi:hypothetical protein GY45DRAFT_1258928 [Cubamyces sp. BRFM 1775]|nr:hypothetical protein GY45DRAFT_1258928 [Cubamyces sp. BRFM 1775]